MKNTDRILIIIFLFSLLSCGIQTHTRKPKSDLKTRTISFPQLDEKVHVEYIRIIKIDTTLNLFKAEGLIGVTVKGSIDKKINSQESKDYFDNIQFIEKTGRDGQLLEIEIIPTLTTTNPNNKKRKPRTTKVKYEYLSNRTNFEFSVEKKIVTPGFGIYVINVTCGEQKSTVYFDRRK